MTIVTVVYPATKSFDYDHYQAVHLALLDEHWREHGYSGASIYRGVAALDGSPAPHALIGLLEFRDDAALQAALASPGTPDILADVANFTDAPPAIQVNQRLV